MAVVAVWLPASVAVGCKPVGLLWALVVFRCLLLSGGLGLSQVGNHHDRDSEMEQQAAEP